MVIPSLFEEQITLASTGRIHQRDPLEAEWAVGLAHFPGAGDYRLRADEYAAHIAAAKRAVAVPVIASLNGADRSVVADVFPRSSNRPAPTPLN